MSWNPWRHLRFAGAVCIIIAAFMGGNMPLTLIGLAIQYLGVVGAVARLEHLMDLLVDKEPEDAIHK